MNLIHHQVIHNRHQTLQNLAQILADFISRNILPAKNIAFSEVKFQAEASNSCYRDQRINRLEG